MDSVETLLLCFLHSGLTPHTTITTKHATWKGLLSHTRSTWQYIKVLNIMENTDSGSNFDGCSRRLGSERKPRSHLPVKCWGSTFCIASHTQALALFIELRGFPSG